MSSGDRLKFEYPNKQAQLLPLLLSTEPGDSGRAGMLLTENDRALEDYLNSLPSGGSGGNTVLAEVAASTVTISLTGFTPGLQITWPTTVVTGRFLVEASTTVKMTSTGTTDNRVILSISGMSNLPGQSSLIIPATSTAGVFQETITTVSFEDYTFGAQPTYQMFITKAGGNSTLQIISQVLRVHGPY